MYSRGLDLPQHCQDAGVLGQYVETSRGLRWLVAREMAAASGFPRGFADNMPQKSARADFGNTIVPSIMLVGLAVVSNLFQQFDPNWWDERSWTLGRAAALQ